MRLRSVLVVLALVCANTAAIAGGPATPSDPGALMRSIGLDGLFQSFGRSIATAPRQNGVTDPRFLRAWEAVSAEAFAGPGLNAALADALGSSLDAGEVAAIEGFLASDFGLRVTALERSAQGGAPAEQIALIAKGRTLYWQVSPRRQAQFEELLSLSNSEVAFAMLRESLRGLALGLRLSSGGDLEVPWEEIDAAVSLRLADLDRSLAEATRGALAYTYRELSDDELEAYLDFLRAPATRAFYATATAAIGSIIRETMFTMGEDVAIRLAAVDI